MPTFYTLSRARLFLTAEQTHSTVDSDENGQKKVLCIISLSFFKDGNFTFSSSRPCV